jgi:hypothetical protein
MADDSYDCKLDGGGYGQSTAETCWYASYAMIFDWKGKPRTAIKENIEKAGLDYNDYYKNGLPTGDFAKVRAALGLVGWRGGYVQTLATDFQSFAQLLKGYGPMWCAFSKPSAHIVVVIGVNASSGNIHVLNPWNNTNGLDADSQYLTSSAFVGRLNTADNSVGQAFM